MFIASLLIAQSVAAALAAFTLMSQGSLGTAFFVYSATGALAMFTCALATYAFGSSNDAGDPAASGGLPEA